MSRPTKILLVEDSESDVARIRGFLALSRGFAYELENVKRFSEALSRLAQGGIDVVLLDLFLPDARGLAMVNKVGIAAPKVPIILLTGVDDDKMAIQAVREGAQDYLVKGEVDPNLIVRAVRHAIERKRIEEALRLSREQSRLIIETANDAFIGMSPDGGINDWNRKAEELFGWTKSEAMQKSVEEILITRGRMTTGSFRTTGRNRLPSRRLEMPARDRSGREFLVEATIWPVKVGPTYHYNAFVHDITERKRAEEELQKAYAEIDQLLASSSSILIGIDQDSRITRWNIVAQQTFAISAEEAIGRSLCDFPIFWDQDGLAELIEKCSQPDRQASRGDIRYTQLRGKEGILSAIVTPVQGHVGASPGFLLLMEDITERRLLENQLAQAQKLESIGQLSAGIAHEINTPTQYVSDNMRFLRDSFGDLLKILEACTKGNGAAPADATADLDWLMEEIPQAIDQALEGVERVANIVRAMKSFSHPGKEEKVAIDIHQAIRDTVVVARHEWKYVAEISTNFDTSMPSVFCYPVEFNQVILNLIVNAAQAIGETPEVQQGGKGQIDISTRVNGDYAEILVRDSGTGIPEEVQPRVFEPFFTTKEVGKGTGQGLSMAYAIITGKHEGELTFDTRVGKGTTFRVRLPLSCVPEVAEEAVPELTRQEP